MLIDSHCHILSDEYEDVQKVIKESAMSGVEKIIINGYDLQTSIEAVEIAETNENVYAAIGIGPENIDGFGEDTFRELKKLLHSKKVVAIGEIGLDYYWTKENVRKQKEVLKKMLELAKNNKLPVIVHSRDALEDTYNVLKEYGVNGIMHCFSGSKEMAKKFIKLGFLIGVGGIVTFKNARKLKEVVESINLSDISIETDSPYLTPEPYRGKKNSPCNIPIIAKKIAEIKGVTLEIVADITSKAVMSKFDL